LWFQNASRREEKASVLEIKAFLERKYPRTYSKFSLNYSQNHPVANALITTSNKLRQKDVSHSKYL
jgi:hypothetical protein